MTSNDPDESGGFASGHPPRPDKPIRNDTAETLWVELRGEGGATLVLDEVVGDVVYVRQPDPGDETSQRIRLEPGQAVVVESPVGAISFHPTDQVGANDMVFSLRVVPERREPGVVFARTLRRDEPDDGRRVHVRPGEQLTLAPGSVSVALDAIDDYYRSVDPERPEGSLASALRVWFGMKSDVQAETLRLAGAAAHRLDAAEHLLRRAELIRSSLVSEDGLGGPQLVAKVDEFIHLVQEVVVALARCIALLRKGAEISPFPVTLASPISTNEAAIKAIRDAYEHIDERAFGRVSRNVVGDGALMIFDHRALIADGVIKYLDHRLDLAEIPKVLKECRAAIKVLAGGPTASTTATS